MVVPVMDSACSRMASTGRRARPAKYHAASPTRAMSPGTANHMMLVILETVLSTSARERWATTVTFLPAIWITRLVSR